MSLGLYAAAALVAWIVMFAVYALVTASLMRRAGLPVQAVSVGIGPALWRHLIGETWYSLRWIPLGASVKCPMDEDEVPSEELALGKDDVPGNGGIAADARAANPRGNVRLFGDLTLHQQLLITVSGHAVVFLIGVALLAVAVVAGKPQLAACDATQSMVQPCGMPGLRWEDTATSVAGQAVLFRETGIEFLGRLLLFRPLDEWGGMFSAVVTAGSVGKQSFVAWVTLIGLMWTLTGLANFLPLPCLAGFQVVQFTAEAIFGRQRLQSLITPLVLVGFLFLLVLHGRLIWLDVQWIRAQWF